MKWFKVHNDIISDPKIRALSFDDRWHFVALMALTNDGTLDEDPDVREMLVEVALGVHGVDLANIKKRLIKLRLIGDDWKPLQWEWRQAGGNPSAALRQRKYRESLKNKKSDVTRDARVTQKVTVEVEVEEEIEKEVKHLVTCGDRDRTVEQPSRDNFEAFWKHYPRKVGKPNARKAFDKHVTTDDLLDTILNNIRQRIECGEWDTGERKQFIPHPATWLNRQGWEDDITPPALTKAQSLEERNRQVLGRFLSTNPKGDQAWIE